jgi:hypothetical protein
VFLSSKQERQDDFCARALDGDSDHAVLPLQIDFMTLAAGLCAVRAGARGIAWRNATDGRMNDVNSRSKKR